MANDTPTKYSKPAMFKEAMNKPASKFMKELNTTRMSNLTGKMPRKNNLLRVRKPR